jgi:hypothetical protein
MFREFSRTIAQKSYAKFQRRSFRMAVGTFHLHDFFRDYRTRRAGFRNSSTERDYSIWSARRQGRDLALGKSVTLERSSTKISGDTKRRQLYAVGRRHYSALAMPAQCEGSPLNFGCSCTQGNVAHERQT